MIRLTKAVDAWGQPDFETVLRQELQQLGIEQLPLQAGLTSSSYALPGNLDVMIISVSHSTSSIRVRAGIFYLGVIAGCSCADDPTPDNDINEYCEVLLDIDRRTAIATVSTS